MVNQITNILGKYPHEHFLRTEQYEQNFHILSKNNEAFFFSQKETEIHVLFVG